jgi:hypothetical protein
MNKTDKAVLAQMAGTWRLVNTTITFQDTGEKIPVPWTGRMIIQPDGAFMWVAHMAGRAVPTTVDERAMALVTMGAEAGTLQIEGDDLISSADFAMDAQVVGNEQRGSYRLSGDQLHSIRAWRPRLSDGRIFRGVTEWARE